MLLEKLKLRWNGYEDACAEDFFPLSSTAGMKIVKTYKWLKLTSSCIMRISLTIKKSKYKTDYREVEKYCSTKCKIKKEKMSTYLLNSLKCAKNSINTNAI